jgi:hypothetical protein
MRHKLCWARQIDIQKRRRETQHVHTAHASNYHGNFPRAIARPTRAQSAEFVSSNNAITHANCRGSVVPIRKRPLGTAASFKIETTRNPGTTLARQPAMKTPEHKYIELVSGDTLLNVPRRGKPCPPQPVCLAEPALMLISYGPFTPYTGPSRMVGQSIAG